ncbi:MAG: hypothetical protein Q7V10_01455 [Methanobacteriaceae archaeon]|nr:hypothetical protein [Methanobacteriaceae archaeon]
MIIRNCSNNWIHYLGNKTIQMLNLIGVVHSESLVEYNAKILAKMKHPN